MENTKEEEEEQLNYTTLNYNKNKKTTLTLCISPSEEPQWGIYRHQGKGGKGDNPWPKARRAPRLYGHGNAAKAAFSRPCGGHARDALSRALSCLSPVSFCARFLVCSP